MADIDPVSNGVTPKSPRFYGRRKGRPLRQSMRQRLDQILPAFVFDPLISPTIQFGRHSDCYLEIGFGGGELAGSQLRCQIVILSAQNLSSTVLQSASLY